MTPPPCRCRKSAPNTTMMQPFEERHCGHLPDALNGNSLIGPAKPHAAPEPTRKPLRAIPKRKSRVADCPPKRGRFELEAFVWCSESPNSELQPGERRGTGERAETGRISGEHISPAQRRLSGPNSAPNLGRIPPIRAQRISGVQIPPSPPSSLRSLALSGEVREIRAVRGFRQSRGHRRDRHSDPFAPILRISLRGEVSRAPSPDVGPEGHPFRYSISDQNSLRKGWRAKHPQDRCVACESG